MGWSLMKIVGVELIPSDPPAVRSATTAAALAGLTTQVSKAALSRPTFRAIELSLSVVNQPLFSPPAFWLAYSQSWYSQNLFWSPAHWAATAAASDSSGEWAVPRNAISRNWYWTMPVATKSLTSWGSNCSDQTWQYGHW